MGQFLKWLTDLFGASLGNIDEVDVTIGGLFVFAFVVEVALRIFSMRNNNK
jgi:hypothetical protein